jgi:hypothetical protein
MVTALVAVPNAAHAQTPTTTVENGSGTVRLQTFHNGALLAPGTYVDDGTENDSIPATGAGTRLMWYPAKAAFRVGRVGGRFGKSDVWNADSVGIYSVATGLDTKATDIAATALGRRTTASELHATALGFETTASGNSATAMGDTTTASGFAATAMGRNTTASGSYATATGFATTASGTDATAMGTNTTAATDHSLSTGAFNSANHPFSDGTLFVVGNGTSDTDRSDALVLDDQGNLTVSGDATAQNHVSSSDRRLKTSVEPLGDGALEKVMGLRPVRYQFKNQKTHPGGEQIGLIAQDVQTEFPSLVSTSSDGMLSLAYPKLTAVLLKGIQEQQTRIEKQQSTIDSLNEEVRQVEALRKRVARLEASSGGSVLAGGPGGRLLIALLIGGLLGVGLLRLRRR